LFYLPEEKEIVDFSDFDSKSRSRGPIKFLDH
jgi:hypothetical protein